MDRNGSILTKIFRAFLFVVMSIAVWLIPLAVSELCNSGLAFLDKTELSDFTAAAERLYQTTVLPGLIDKAMSHHSLSALEIGRLLFVLAMGLPVNALIQGVLSKIAGVTGFKLGKIDSKSGKYKTTGWTSKVMVAVESAWFAFVNYLVDKYYGKQNLYLIGIAAIVLFVWIGYEASRKYRNQSVLFSLLIDLLDSILELPVIAVMTACLFAAYGLTATMPLMSAAAIGALLLFMWLYGKGKLFGSVILFYLFRIGCFGAAIYLSGYLAKVL